MNNYQAIGTHRHYSTCRFCLSKQLTIVIHLGNMPLAGGFLEDTKLFTSEKLYPLDLAFCQNCYLLQSINVINADTLFKDYFYHSSAIKTLTDHFAITAKELVEKTNTKNFFAVEIGCNDGTFINALKANNIRALGIDPASNIVKPLIKKGMPIINDYFTEKLAKKIVKKHGKADLIFSSNVLAHIEDMHDIVKGIKPLLKPNGRLVFEVHYLGNLIKEMQYDMIYHEHQYYYSLLTLNKFFAMYDMEIYDTKRISTHAGSMRYYVQHKKTGENKISKNVTKVLKEEKKLKLDKFETYITYAKRIKKTKDDLLKLLQKLKKQNKIIAGYGASGRGTILMNYCGLDKKLFEYVVDDAPAKQGRYTPGTHLKIVSSKILQSKKRPDYIVLFAWSFWEEIKKRNKEYIANGGKFIIPLPKVKVI